MQIDFQACNFPLTDVRLAIHHLFQLEERARRILVVETLLDNEIPNRLPYGHVSDTSTETSLV